ncbi:hypothetical protein NPIL_654801 [Nephila pilipes]|uniref:HAT C-terminal dimerisation domain-containing protein n=1 Tax=Nephila pilipes TaxID=299642 RepID=A0A8X6MT86_NEPPI|nr:hypothetical protein NPIL_654801 [Nephila pilipes]
MTFRNFTTRWFQITGALERDESFWKSCTSSLKFISRVLFLLKDDPFKFYRDNYNHKKSHIAKVATKCLSVMATSVISERVFSITGRIISEKRSRLKGENVNKLFSLQTEDKRYK